MSLMVQVFDACVSNLTYSITLKYISILFPTMYNPRRAHLLFSINTHFFYDCTLSIDRQPSSLYRSHNNEPCLQFSHFHALFILLFHYDIHNTSNGSTVILNIHIRLQITKHASTVINGACFLMLFYIQSSGQSKVLFLFPYSIFTIQQLQMNWLFPFCMILT